MSNMTSRKYPEINEVVYTKVLDNNLAVYVIPKKDYKKKFAIFMVNFGAETLEFYDPNHEKNVKVPAGVAHFLEHKIFEMENGEDASSLFTSLGIESNAYTSYTETAYLISGINNFEKGIELLLDFVQKPHFTVEGVEKEKGIIQQERKMVLDNASDRLNSGINKNMYFDNARKIDIVGDEQSIDNINQEILNLCYENFYQPANMYLTICGDVDVDEIIKIVEENQYHKEFNEKTEIRKILYREKNIVREKNNSCKMDIIIPKAAVAVKLPVYDYEHNKLLKKEYEVKLLLEMLLGTTSPYYQEMLDREYISSFSYTCNLDHNSPSIKVVADTYKPKEFIKYIKNIFKNFNSFKIEEQLLNKMKKAIIGNFVKLFNGVENIAIALTEYKLKNCNIFDLIDIINEITVSDLMKYIDVFNDKAITSFTVLPK